MGLLESIVKDAREAARQRGIAVLEDPCRLLAPGDEGDGIRVLPYRTHTGFRRGWEPMRRDEGQRPVLVHVTHREPFYPDVLALCVSEGQRLRITAQLLLQRATGDDHWPAAMDELASAVAGHLEAIVSAHGRFVERHGAGMSDEDARLLVLSGITGVDLFDRADPVATWRLYFEHEQTVAGLGEVHESFPGELADRVRGLGGVFGLLADGEAGLARELLWLAAVLGQHVRDPRPLLATLSTRYFDAQEWDAAELSALAKRLEEEWTSGARAQVLEAEESLDEAAWGKVAQACGLTSLEGALRVAEAETRSPKLLGLAVWMALPHLAGTLDPEVTARIGHLVDEYAGGKGRRLPPLIADEEFPQRACALLETLWELRSAVERAPETVRRAIEESEGAGSVAPLVDAYTRTALHSVEFLSHLAKRREEDLAATDAIEGDLGRKAREGTKKAVEALQEAAAKALLELNRAFGNRVVADYPSWITTSSGPLMVSGIIERVLLPHWDGAKRPPTIILLMDGMRWDVWARYVRPALQKSLEFVGDAVDAQPALAILPSSTRHSRRALFAGKRPDGFGPTEAEDKLLAAAWRDGPRRFTVEKSADVDEKAQIALKMVAEGITVIVFSFCDKILHGFNDSLAALYEENIKPKAMRELAKVLKEMPEGALVLVVTDHGFVEMTGAGVGVPVAAAGDRSDITQRYALLQKECRIGGGAHVFSGDEVKLPGVHSVVVAREHAFLKRDGWGGKGDRYGHGGISLQELVVPCAVLRAPAKDALAEVVLRGFRLEPEEAVAGSEVALECELLLKGATTAEVSVEVSGAVEARETVSLMGGETRTVRLSFVAPPHEGAEEAREAAVDLRVVAASGAKLKLPLKRRMKLRVVADSGRVQRETSDTLDGMLGKRRR